jgi:L-malate glycosyltransferase
MNKNKKIMLHIIMPNQVSGPNKAAKLISDSFLNQKYEFSFLTQTFHSGKKINLKLIKDLSRQIKLFNPDLIHLSGLQGSCFHAVIAARLSGKKNILIAVRGSTIDAKNLSAKMRFIFGNIIEPLTIKLSKNIYTVCEAMRNRKYIIQNARHKLIGTIHNSAPKIDINEIIPFNLRNKLNIDDKTLIVAIVGRIVFDKGVTYIADAIKKITDKNIKFIFIGDEPKVINLSTTLNNEVKEKRVFFLGKQEKVINILNECDIFLFATLHENLSNALLEACSLGLAVIATNVGGNPEVIKDDFNGILIPPANSDIIVEKVILLANNEEMRIKLGETAKLFVRDNFNQEQLLKKLELTYSKMLNKSLNEI